MLVENAEFHGRSRVASLADAIVSRLEGGKAFADGQMKSGAHAARRLSIVNCDQPAAVTARCAITLIRLAR